jgi:chromosome segregation ATPase
LFQDYFDAEPTFKQSYAPQSGEIFGILKQMKETFEANLAQTQKDEQNNQKAYEELKAAKEEEIKAGQDQIDAKTQELASTDEKLAESKEDLEDTKKSFAADEEFLAMLKEKCSGTDAEWEERQKTRQQPMISWCPPNPLWTLQASHQCWQVPASWHQSDLVLP